MALKPKRRLIRKLLGWLLAAAVLAHLAAACWLVLLRWVNPPLTGIRLQRRVEALLSRKSLVIRHTPVSLDRISPNLQHAVVAAEDARFYMHHGIDWKEVQQVLDDELEDGRPRGASTITQQLVKNLFFTTHRNPLRKAAEFTLAPMADRILGKQRILELYLNQVEWGPGVFGAEAAARYHYGDSARRLDRERAARLAAILPAPRRRKPARMNRYSAAILVRMSQVGW